MGNVVNSHRDLKTQLIISHLRKIYSEVVGARGGYRSRCRGYARRDDTSNYTNVHLARAPCWGAPWRGAGSWRAGRAVRAVRRLRVVRETPGALHTRPSRAAPGAAPPGRSGHWRQDRPTRRITAYGYASSRVCHFSLRDS